MVEGRDDETVMYVNSKTDFGSLRIVNGMDSDSNSSGYPAVVQVGTDLEASVRVRNCQATETR